ncbi:zinc dependent phospholipase C family protein [Chitinophagaceae bacterium LB-8]|uniref:Zinc dependent phospholipase C family protein n=1 Tax=Paraflavisolibacter caeni TaxID=2982496 RepID=A0A9X2XTV8_9BACT|nr:zinc dependent phospholipase C family protein [Paraflavisolibacter caeni]MCU7548745.1 zinc dependent phospholipase C family protein [Paraflavisolibacter caeni]
MKKVLLLVAFLSLSLYSFSWGFYAHRRMSYYAVFLLPPQMLAFYKPHIHFISEHAVDPDKRRYMMEGEAQRHFIDMDRYGSYPFETLPRKWEDAIGKFSEDSLQQHGIVPWWTQIMLRRLTNAFKEKNAAQILKLSADISHYVADAHVPLHTNSNYNGQFTGQKGIHAFWESRVPELLAEQSWDFFLGKASYISNPTDFIWKRVLESAVAADTVLRSEKALTNSFSTDRKFAFEERNGVITRQYSTSFSKAYDALLKGMIERRMRQSIFAIASFWYTAWVNAGQPDLTRLDQPPITQEEQQEFELLNNAWKAGNGKGREHE